MSAAYLATPTPAPDLRAFIWPESTAVRPGADLEVTVWVNPVTHGISGGEIHVAFPDEVFEATGYRPGDLLGHTPIVGYEELNESGFVRLALARVGPTASPSPQGVFVTIDLSCKEDAATGQYRIDLQAVLANERFEDISVASVRGGLVTVQVR